MFPTIKQYKNWSLPSKYGFWGLILALIPLTIDLSNWIRAVPSYAVLGFNYGKSEMTIYGDAGESPSEAVLIRGANSHEAGVKAEYYWIKRRFPGYKVVNQALIASPEPGSSRIKTVLTDAATGASVEAVEPAPLPERNYDILKIRKWRFIERDIFFDVTTFFSKGDEPRPAGLSGEEARRLTRQRLDEAIAAKRRQANTNDQSK